jgi:hypothetical protein
MLIWLTVQGGLKVGCCGLAVAAMALLLRLVYGGPDSSAAFIGSLPFSTALVWLGRIGRALFAAGTHALASSGPRAFVLGTLLTLLASLYPTCVAARMKPVVALRVDL